MILALDDELRAEQNATAQTFNCMSPDPPMSTKFDKAVRRNDAKARSK